MTIPGTLRAYLTIGAFIVVGCLLFAVLTMCQGGARQKAQLQTQNATGKALDKVTTQTATINTDTKAKQDEADKIPGADDRLPDGYGARLECVRRGSECPNP